MSTLLAFLPLLGLMLLVALFSPLLMNGWLFSFKPLHPNFSKLDPLAGIARMFSTNSLMELGKGNCQGNCGGWYWDTGSLA